jgi:fucose permease
VLAGAGGGAVDAGLNAFAAARFKPRHLNWLHGFYGVGAALGPAAAAALLAAASAGRRAMPRSPPRCSRSPPASR